VSAWRRFRRNRLALGGLLVAGTLAGLAAAAPLLPLPDPHATAPAARLLPAGTPGHLLGTDQLGRDLLARLVWGARTSLAVGAVAVLAAALAGSLLGLAAGYYRGWVEALLMRGVDVLLAFPYLLLALAIVAALGPGLVNAMLAIAVANVPFFARTVRGAVAALAGGPLVEAARLAGAGDARILFRELLPNVLPVVVVMMSTNLGWMILETAGLSFLGLGAQPPTADLGSMLGGARELLATEPRVALLPGVVILVLVVSVNLVGDGLRDVLDPRLAEPAPAATAPDPPQGGPPAEAGEGALLRVEGLAAVADGPRGAQRLLDDVTLELAPGERLGVVGESGSGKTMLALSLLGLLPPPARVAGGRVLLRGEDLARAAPARLRALRGARLAYVPQDPGAALDPVLPVGAQMVEALGAHASLGRRAARRRAAELLARVRLPDPDQLLGAWPHELSGGMRQRVLIAMALAHDPAVIVADEATTALDVTVQAEVLELLDRLCAEEGAALMFISHDLTLVAGLCSRALVLYAGRVVEEGPVAGLLSAPAHPYTRALVAAAPELGRPDKPLDPVPGQPPPPDGLPPGCHFAPRCPHAAPRCREGPMPLRAFGEGRVRCVRAQELPPWRP
jgi:peptide/nickel transport system permease protein